MNTKKYTLIAWMISAGVTGAFAASGQASAGVSRSGSGSIEISDSSNGALVAKRIEVSDEPSGGGGAFVWSGLDNFYGETFGGAPRAKTLVIRSGEADAKTVSAPEEDLSIMSRILAKAVKNIAGNEDALTAMGMKIRALAWPNASGVQNIYLDKYGALFFLNVPFPLLAPPEKAEKEVSKETSDSTWEEAKRELYGPREGGGGIVRLFGKDKPSVEYDARKVEKLKESVLQALKNAKNIRNLKSEEYVTVTVIGSEASPSAAVAKPYPDEEGSKARTAPNRMDVRFRGHAVGGETVMTLRAKKADVDAFAAGKLDLDEFKSKVAVAIY